MLNVLGRYISTLPIQFFTSGTIATTYVLCYANVHSVSHVAKIITKFTCVGLAAASVPSILLFSVAESTPPISDKAKKVVNKVIAVVSPILGIAALAAYCILSVTMVSLSIISGLISFGILRSLTNEDQVTKYFSEYLEKSTFYFQPGLKILSFIFDK